ncbi:hypothetical protein Drorol1_Dr00012797 [Drosera rotundifolia]
MQDLIKPKYLRRSNSTTTMTTTPTTTNILLLRSSSAYTHSPTRHHHNEAASPRSLSRFFVTTRSLSRFFVTTRSGTDHNFLSGIIRSFINTIVLSLPTITSCSIIPHSSSPRKVTGTLFGHRKGHVTFAVQLHPTVPEPILLLELATSTAVLVKEMASGTVRIVLETQKGVEKTSPAMTTAARENTVARGRDSGARGMYEEPVWDMYCNGRKCGYAVKRARGELDWFVLGTVGSVSVGAGVIPVVMNGGGDGEVLYMRAGFERVVGSKDSEAFHMLNPDGNYGPELSIFLLRL